MTYFFLPDAVSTIDPFQTTDLTSSGSYLMKEYIYGILQTISILFDGCSLAFINYSLLSDVCMSVLSPPTLSMYV